MIPPPEHGLHRPVRVRLHCAAGHTDEISVDRCTVVFQDSRAVAVEYLCRSCGEVARAPATDAHLRLLTASGSRWSSRPATIAVATDREA